MILSPLDPSLLGDLTLAFDRALGDDPLAREVFRRITTKPPEGDLLTLSEDPDHHAQAVALCQRFGFGILDLDPQDFVTWDGHSVACRMAPSVLIHEVAHYQCAAPARRRLVDFGLGAGPESGCKAEGMAQQALFTPDIDVEEGLSSLLGILWEAALDQPAVLAFLEQNWLEGGDSLHNVAHFRKVVRWLYAMGLITAAGEPTTDLRREDDETFFQRWFQEAKER
ncbi:MAG TPA: hypothetical protein HPP80_03425 [Rhodospirillaceae bacterium]|nr:hypothetical protein [Rhodospirillaceae bacterium]